MKVLGGREKKLTEISVALMYDMVGARRKIISLL